MWRPTRRGDKYVTVIVDLPRCGEWPTQLLTELCAELDLVHVVEPMHTETVTPEQTYYRLHGTAGSRHVHTDDELRVRGVHAMTGRLDLSVALHRLVAELREATYPRQKGWTQRRAGAR